MPITIKELADIAKVSTATVSMVINNKPGISQPTRERVLSIVESYGYNISPLKNGLAKRNGTIQLTIYKKHSQVVADTAFFEALIAGIEATARHNGYQLTIKSIPGKRLDTDLICAELNNNAIDGIVLLGTEMDEQDMKLAMKIEVPLLVLDACFLGISSNYVVIDNISGVYMGVTHLIENGHRKIGYLRSSVEIQNFLERYEGYAKAISGSGLDCNHEDTVRLRPTIEGAYEDMLAYLANNQELPTAYFCDNDIIAFGAMKALKENGIRMPEEVSLVGFDDMPFCTITEPALSTISVNKKRLGTFAVENLIGLIESTKDYHSKTLLGVDLISRDSVFSKQT